MGICLNHSFNIKFARVYGVDCGIMIHHFQYWIMKNYRLKKNLKDGSTWTYQTLDEIQSNFPYWSKKQVRKIIDKLVTHLVLKKGNYNNSKYDRTIWYAFVDEQVFGIKDFGQIENPDLSSICPNGQMEKLKEANGKAQKGTPIPDTNKQILDTYKKKEDKERWADKRPTASSISLDMEKRCFIGITANDIIAWKEKFPDVGIERELTLCAEWAMTTPRKNYRKSILTWFTNVGKDKFKNQQDNAISKEEENIILNRNAAKELQEIYREIQIKEKYVKDPDCDSKEFSLNLPTASFKKMIYDHFYQKHHKEFEDICR